MAGTADVPHDGSTAWGEVRALSKAASSELALSFGFALRTNRKFENARSAGDHDRTGPMRRNEMPNRHILAGSLAAALLCSASIAAASGFIASPEQQQKMESFGACLAFLENSAAQDSKSEAPLTRDPEGNRRAVTVERKTNGIERSGAVRARYGARIWYSNGRPRQDLKQIEYRASWEEHDYECRGRTLTINTSQGYTLESYQPMDADEAAGDQSAQTGETGDHPAAFHTD
jgi:hypothetical protein